MAASITIRAVRPDDVQQVVALVRDTLAEFGLTFGQGAATDEELRRLPSSYDDQGGAFWVCVDRGQRVLGTCGVFPVGPGTFELRKMYLSPELRGTGVGKRLLDETTAWARANGGRSLVLDTTEQMTRAIRFYESAGFVRDDTQVRGARCSRGYSKSL
jgi:putative acetyltransferase